MSHQILLLVAVGLASAVEMVEALTIVLAVGLTRGWRSTMPGVGAAIAVLAAVVVVLGPAVSRLPISDLRLVVGALLLVFGLQWLRKAILRASGYKALHDEDAIFATEQAAAAAAAAEAGTGATGGGRAGSGSPGRDWYAFTVAFKGVLLEGLEVAFIVVTFGGSQHDIGLAAIGAGGAALVVLLAGVLVHKPLSRVPENSLKFVVGMLLTTFGTFWSGEGAGLRWPGADASLFALLGIVALASAGAVHALRRQHARTHPALEVAA